MAMYLHQSSIEELFGNKNSALFFYERKKKNFLEVRVAQMLDDNDLIIAWIKYCLLLVEQTKKYKDFLSMAYYDILVDPVVLSNIQPSRSPLKMTKYELSSLKKSLN